MRMRIVLVALFLGAMQAGAARAQEAPECFPPCRSGFMCLNGACVSECNPPCPDGQQCQGGECILPAAPAQPAPPPTAAPPAPPPTAAPPVAAAPPAPAAPAPESQGWVTLGPNPNAPPPAQGDSHREERRRIRKLFHILGYVTPSLLLVSPPQNNGVDFEQVEFDEFGYTASSDFVVFGIGLAFGIRHNFAYIVGLQSRLYFDLMPSISGYTVLDDDVGACQELPENCEASGLGFRFGADVTFRFGPFAQAFPMYIGVGGFAGARQVSASSDVADYNSFEEELGLTSELGFVFGGRENLDLGLRFQVTPGSTLGGFLSFGLAFASI